MRYATFALQVAAILDLAAKREFKGWKNLNPMIFMLFDP